MKQQMDIVVGNARRYLGGLLVGIRCQWILQEPMGIFESACAVQSVYNEIPSDHRMERDRISRIPQAQDHGADGIRSADDSALDRYSRGVRQETL